MNISLTKTLRRLTLSSVTICKFKTWLDLPCVLANRSDWTIPVESITVGQQTTAMSYGAVETSEQDATDADTLSSFQEFDMLYVKDRKLTTGERLRKCMSLVLPILVALLIVAFFASFSLRAVRPLSPDDRVQKHSTSSDESAHRGPPIGKPAFATVSPKASEVSPPVSPSSPSKSSGSSSSSKCSANEACEELELTGHCCPTLAGKRFGVSMIASLLLINSDANFFMKVSCLDVVTNALEDIMGMPNLLLRITKNLVIPAIRAIDSRYDSKHSWLKRSTTYFPKNERRAYCLSNIVL
jgi:hypothetical protein